MPIDIYQDMSLGSVLNNPIPSPAASAAQPGIEQQQTTYNANTTQVDSGQATSASIPLVNQPTVANQYNTGINNTTANTAATNVHPNNSPIPFKGFSAADVDSANRAIDHVSSLSKDSVLGIAEEVKPILSSHVYRAGLSGNLSLTNLQLAVIKGFMSDNPILSRNNAHTYGGVIRQGYFSLGGENKLKFCGPTSKTTNFYKAYTERVLLYRNDNYILHKPR